MAGERLALERLIPVGDEPVLDFTDLTTSGSGVARLPDGRAVFVAGVLPGERARVGVTADRGSHALGEAREIVVRSGDRRDPECPLFGVCGGCQLQHLEYAAQVRWKASRIAQTLRRIGGLDVAEPPVVAAPEPWRYRNRMSFTLKRLRSGRTIAGLHATQRAGHVIEVADECLLPEPVVARGWAELRSSWGKRAGLLPPGSELRLTVRSADEGFALVIDGGGPGGDLERLVRDTRGLRSVVHRDDKGRTVRAGEPATVEEVWMGQGVSVASTAFLQVNRRLGKTLHEWVLECVGSCSGRRVVDAYCGVGAYGRRMAAEGATVRGIELDAGAAAAAGRGAPEGFEILQGRVEDRLAECLPSDLVLLNPPRSGLGTRVPQMLAEARVDEIVYVSCDPATLARDLRRLGPGYQVRELRGFDLFPQTTQVETAIILDRVNDNKVM